MPNAYDAVTSRLIAQLEAGVIPWRQPWKNRAHGAHLPTNFATGRSYRGINFAVLLFSGYASPLWMTYKQAAAMGAQVRKGERGTPVVFWQFDNTRAIDGKKGAPWCKNFTVFNVAQIDGLAQELPFDAPTFEPLEAAQSVVDAYLGAGGPSLKHGGSSACYVPSTDTVHMPFGTDFVTREKYYCTLFHEFGHSTGAARRLARDLSGAFGSKNYAAEELVAEFTAAFLSAETGCTSDDLDAHNAAYIAGWLHTFRADNRIAVMAAQRAQKAADLILGRAAAGAVDAEAVASEELGVAA